jgi:SpoVK/Ycf46/Vps4 family AAA+-type ATPase
MAPIVLWIDEIEKGFAAAAAHSSDGGLTSGCSARCSRGCRSTRSPVFLIATANDIEALPPELLRKGASTRSFSSIFRNPMRAGAIFTIHLAKRRRDASKFDWTRS